MPSLMLLSQPQIAQLYRQLAALLDMGYTPASAIDMLLRETRNPFMRKQLCALRDDLWQGVNLAEALRRRRALAPEDHCAMLLAGATAGHLGETFRRLAEMAESTDVLRRFVNKELAPSKITLLSPSQFSSGSSCQGWEASPVPSPCSARWHYLS